MIWATLSSYDILHYSIVDGVSPYQTVQLQRLIWDHTVCIRLEDLFLQYASQHVQLTFTTSLIKLSCRFSTIANCSGIKTKYLTSVCHYFKLALIVNQNGWVCTSQHMSKGFNKVPNSYRILHYKLPLAPFQNNESSRNLVQYCCILSVVLFLNLIFALGNTIFTISL